MKKHVIEFSTEETRAIIFLIGTKKIGQPVPPNFEFPVTLVSKGVVSVDDSGESHITDDQEWRLLRMGMHPSQNR